MNLFKTLKEIARSTDLSDKAKAVATRLALYLNDGVANPTVAQLANETGRDKRRVQEALAELQAKGWLLRTFPKGQNASKKPTIYRLTAKATGQDPRGAESRTPRDAEIRTQKEKTKERPKKEGADAPFPTSIWGFRGSAWESAYHAAGCKADMERTRLGFKQWTDRTGKPRTLRLFYNFCRGQNQRLGIAA